ncbi:MAG: TonB-dependent receptor [Bacteroidetes bacterium]|nr:TonB-dependent receptor [Bacteroidota bacterium]
MKTIKTTIALLAMIISGSIAAQSSGIIKGTIVDEKGAKLLFVPVAILQDNKVILSAETDENGEFTFKQITPGTYDVKSTFVGFETKLIKEVSINPNKTRYVNISMVPSAASMLGVIVIEEKFIEPAFDPQFSTATPISIDQIERAAVGKTDIVALITMVTPNVLPTNDGKDIYIRGSRRGTTGYYVDGNKTLTVPDVPGLGIGAMEVLTGGVPAEYGDCTGGLVIITTKEYKWEMARKQNRIDDRKESAEVKMKPEIE